MGYVYVLLLLELNFVPIFKKLTKVTTYLSSCVYGAIWSLTRVGWDKQMVSINRLKLADFSLFLSIYLFLGLFRDLSRTTCPAFCQVDFLQVKDAVG